MTSAASASLFTHSAIAPTALVPTPLFCRRHRHTTTLAHPSSRGHTSWHRSAFSLILLLVVTPATVGAQAASQGFKFNLEPTAAALTQRKEALSQLEQSIKQALPKNVPVSAERVRLEAREAWAHTVTLHAWYDGLTSASQKWLRQFLDNVRPRGYTNFQTFLTANGNRTLAALRDSLPKGSQATRFPPRDPSSSGAAPSRRLPLPIAQPSPRPPPPPTPTPSTTTAYGAIGGSKLVAYRAWDGAPRYHLTTPSQSIFLRGTPANTSTGCSGGGRDYPSYCNTYCTACCGPAAAQSLFAWYNIPVKTANGTVATTTRDIQKRLAELMETTDGIDYTDPDDFDSVLRRAEFQGTKNYCYQKGDGSRAQLHYMLSRGAPVTLLWTTGSYAHYVTVYGYDVENDLYDLANSERLHWETLRHRWSFEAGEDDTNAALSLVGGQAYSLWSYADTGCSVPWDFAFDLGWDFVTASALPEVYYATFMADYVWGASDPALLNFYAYLSSRSSSILPTARVSSGGEVTPLSAGNTHVIASTAPVVGQIRNNSVGVDVDITVDVDKSFVDTYPDVYCGFAVLGVMGVPLQSDYRLCRTVASASLPSTYQYRYRAPYDFGQREVVFVVHGGLRQASWRLGGCLLDTDGDGLCNEVDPDDDNDGVPDVRDNCPLVANVDQRDDDHNGIGFVCDSCERCMF